MTAWLLAWVLACAPAAPELVCPENTSLKEVKPVVGGRAVWCERKNGTRFGPFVEYRADGTRWKDGEVVGVRKEGLFHWYHPNGQLRETCTYAANQRAGTRTLYDASGRKIQEESWVSGSFAAGTAWAADGTATAVTSPAPDP